MLQIQLNSRRLSHDVYRVRNWGVEIIPKKVEREMSEYSPTGRSNYAEYSYACHKEQTFKIDASTLKPLSKIGYL
jgi:hypothetical protein